MRNYKKKHNVAVPSLPRRIREESSFKGGLAVYPREAINRMRHGLPQVGGVREPLPPDGLGHDDWGRDDEIIDVVDSQRVIDEAKRQLEQKANNARAQVREPESGSVSENMPSPESLPAVPTA